jgi:hypothetical protein
MGMSSVSNAFSIIYGFVYQNLNLFNRMIVEELTEYFIASQIDV